MGARFRLVMRKVLLINIRIYYFENVFKYQPIVNFKRLIYKDKFCSSLVFAAFLRSFKNYNNLNLINIDVLWREVVER